MKIKLKILLLILLPTVISFLSYSQNIIQIQPGPSDGFDTFVHTIYPDSNLSSRPSLVAAAWTYQGDFGIIRSLFRFDLESIDPSTQIDSAHINLYYNPTCGHEGHGGVNSAWLRRVIDPWNEQSVCWNNQPSTSQINQVYLPPSTSVDQDYSAINVTEIVQQMISEPDSNFGFQLKINIEEVYRSLTFASSDHPIDSIRPKLEIYLSCYLNLGNDTTLCSGDTLILSGGPNFSNYLWNSGSTDSVIYVTSSGLYWLEATDNFNCTIYDTILVEFQEFPDIFLGNDTSLCFESSLTLNPGIAYSEYLWQDSSTSMQFVVTEPGTYYVSAQNECGVSSDTISVEYFPELNINIGNDTILCENETLLLDAGFGFQQYLWQDGSSNQIFIANYAGNYWVVVTDENNCSKMDDINIEQIILPVNLGADTAICPGTELILTVGSSFDGYIWLDSTSLENYYIADTSGTYWVTCFDTIDQKVCFKTDSIQIGLLNLPFSPNIYNEYGICPGNEILINAGIGKDFNYLWSNSTTDSSILLQETGIYYVAISNACDTIIKSVEIYFYPIPQFEIQVDTISSNNFLLTINQDFESFLWSTGSTDSWIKPDNSDIYWAEVKNEYNCSAIDSIIFESIDCNIYTPNVITPNQDYLNDYFYVESQDITDFEVTIFNRWGELVYKSNDKDFIWDGTHNGHNCREGTYFFIMSYNCNKFTQNLQSITLKGSIILLR